MIFCFPGLKADYFPGVLTAVPATFSPQPQQPHLMDDGYTLSSRSAGSQAARKNVVLCNVVQQLPVVTLGTIGVLLSFLARLAPEPP